MPLTQNTQQALFSNAPNCWKCQHFGVTYEPRMPYLCRLMGIKTRSLPSAEVLRVDGQVCRGFVLKPAMPTAAMPHGNTATNATTATTAASRVSSRMV